MLPGKFVGVITNFDDPLELTGKTREGYLKLAWRSDSSIKVGYIIMKKGKILGAIVEDVLNNTSIQGDIAFVEIVEAIKQGLVKSVEIYEANVEEILNENPKAYITEVSTIPSSGKDLESFLSLLKMYKGSIEIQDGSKAWILYVEHGIVKAARGIRGSNLRGDSAIREIFREMGHLLKEGKYTTSDRVQFSSSDTVKKGEIFIEGLELLKEKRRLEKGF